MFIWGRLNCSAWGGKKSASTTWGWVETLEDWSRKVWPQSGKGEKVGLDPSKAKVFEGVHASTLEESFLDGAFDQSGKVLFEQVDKDKEFEPEANEIEDFWRARERAKTPMWCTTSRSLLRPLLKWLGRLEPADWKRRIWKLLCPWRRGMRLRTKGSPRALSSLPLDKDPSGNLLQVAVPACGSRGSFTYLGAQEAIDSKTEACVRCFGKSGTSCSKLCSFTLGESKRCARRCTTDCSSTGVHLCHVHEWYVWERKKILNEQSSSLHVLRCLNNVQHWWHEYPFGLDSCLS